MIKSLIDQPPLVALEIGTSKVRAIVGEHLEDGSLMITGLGECASCGVRKGEIIDFGNAQNCVRTALQAAEENGRVDIRTVLLALTGGHIRNLINSGAVPVMDPGHGITERDMEHARETARAVNLPTEQDVLHTICQKFYVDDQAGVVDPEGMVGAQLKVDMLILHGSRTRMRNLVKAVTDLKIDVQDAAFSGFCAALAVITPEEKESGVALIDLGAGTTDYVVYAGNAIALAGVLAVGGDHVTNDIARAFCVPLLEAERLKEVSGSAIADLASRTQRIGLAADTGQPERTFRVADLNTVIQLRMEETFNLLKRMLDEHDLRHALGGGIVLTGGGAHMRNIERLAERVFGLPCRIGRPRNVTGLAVVTEGPEYATTVGAIRYGIKAGRQEKTSAWKTLLGYLLPRRDA